jgi:hypothetical protein
MYGYFCYLQSKTHFNDYEMLSKHWEYKYYNTDANNY